MNEEILRIQRMVAEGKISNEEGAKLIETLDQTSTASHPTRRKWFIFGIIMGGILCAGPLWGLIGTIVEMQMAFNSNRDPSQLASDIDQTWSPLLIGWTLVPLGLVILIISIIGLSRRKKMASI
jgi:hypothetical protein